MFEHESDPESHRFLDDHPQIVETIAAVRVREIPGSPSRV